MTEATNPAEDRSDESLANIPPAPISDGDSSPTGWLPWGVAVVVVGGGLWALLDSSSGSCRGATRSAKLRWELQRAEIDAAVDDWAAKRIAPETTHGSENTE
jgi:hypothetical protein